jgi:putative transposase
VGSKGHADLIASETFLVRQTEQAVRPMARAVRLEWDSHEWLETSHSHRPKQQRTDRSTVNSDGNVAAGESA